VGPHSPVSFRRLPPASPPPRLPQKREGGRGRKRRKRRKREKNVGIKIRHTSHFFVRGRKRGERKREKRRTRRKSWKRSHGMIEENETERGEVRKLEK
jgi:hypothetical protein